MPGIRTTTPKRDELPAVLLAFLEWLENDSGYLYGEDDLDNVLARYLEHLDTLPHQPVTAPAERFCAYCARTIQPDHAVYYKQDDSRLLWVCYRCAAEVPGTEPAPVGPVGHTGPPSADEYEDEIPF